MHRKASTPSARVAVIAAAAAITSLALAPSPPLGAQARFVQVSLRVFPSIPAPGDDVSVDARINGCVPGGTTVEAYLTSNDGTTDSSALMARTDAKTTLLFRTRATIELPDAAEGWYGLRVICGTFRPPRGPMATTTFAVGANPTKSSQLSGDVVSLGSTLRYTGTGCASATVEYDITQTGLKGSPFLADGSIPTNADGTWAFDLPFIRPPINPGPAEIRTRCVLPARFGENGYVYYRLQQVRVEGPVPTVAPGGG